MSHHPKCVTSSLCHVPPRPCHILIPKRTQDAALVAPTAWKTFWSEDGPQSGFEGFAQLDGPFLRDLPLERTTAGVRCTADGKTGPAKPQLDSLENGAVFTHGGYGTKKRRP